jgi:hypothetical protein
VLLGGSLALQRFPLSDVEAQNPLGLGPRYLAGARAPEMSTTIATLISTATR